LVLCEFLQKWPKNTFRSFQAFLLLIFVNRPTVLFPSFCVIFYPLLLIPQNVIKYTIYFFVIISINM
jgi:hypothetical protein